MPNNQLGGRDPEHPGVPDDTKHLDEPAGYRPEEEDPMVGSPGSIENSTHPFYSLEIVPAIENEVGSDTGHLREEKSQPSRDYEVKPEDREKQRDYSSRKETGLSERDSEVAGQEAEEEFLRNLG